MPNFVNALPVKLFEYMSAECLSLRRIFPLWRQIIEDRWLWIAVDPP